MKVAHLNQKQLAVRWSISEATLERWRSEGIGPKFMKLKGRVLYRSAYDSGASVGSAGGSGCGMKACSDSPSVVEIA